MMVVLQNECSLSGGDTKLLLAVKNFALSGVGNTKTLGAGMSAWVQALSLTPMPTFTTYI